MTFIITKYPASDCGPPAHGFTFPPQGDIHTTLKSGWSQGPALFITFSSVLIATNRQSTLAILTFHNILKWPHLAEKKLRIIELAA